MSAFVTMFLTIGARLEGAGASASGFEGEAAEVDRLAGAGAEARAFTEDSGRENLVNGVGKN